jgi:hypothetical protein
MENRPVLHNNNNNNNIRNETIQWSDQSCRQKCESSFDVQSDFKRRSDQSESKLQPDSEIRDPDSDSDSRRHSDSKSDSKLRLRQGYLPHASDSKFLYYICDVICIRFLLQIFSYHFIIEKHGTLLSFAK